MLNKVNLELIFMDIHEEFSFVSKQLTNIPLIHTSLIGCSDARDQLLLIA
jgi:hypothetical protein